MTGTKTLTFEDLPVPEFIELNCEWTYYYDAGRSWGKPENGYPPEMEIDINLDEGWQDIVMGAYVQNAKKAIVEIEARVQGMLDDEEPAQWASDRDDYID